MFGGSGFARGQSGAEGGDVRSCGSKVKKKERGREREREREKEKKKEKKDITKGGTEDQEPFYTWLSCRVFWGI